MWNEKRREFHATLGLCPSPFFSFFLFLWEESGTGYYLRESFLSDVLVF
jgi:hypothetical protein